MREGIVIATCREDAFNKWHSLWKSKFNDAGACLFVMVDTHDRKIVDEIKAQVIFKEQVYCHEDVEKEIGSLKWIIPEKTGACKSFAIYQAWKAGCERIYCLDDDCYPVDEINWIATHKFQLGKKALNDVFMTGENVRPRGVPYLPMKPVMLSHGLWTKVPDVDAVTQMSGYPSMMTMKYEFIPKGCLFPFCGMNWACNREIVPLMYFGLQGPLWGYDRFDDIWCGFIAKKILDHLDMAVWSGGPIVKHERLSNQFDNIEKEASGYRMNCIMYQWAMDLKFLSNDIIGCMKEAGESLIEFAKEVKGDEKRKSYLTSYGKAINSWVSLFNKKEV